MSSTSREPVEGNDYVGLPCSLPDFLTVEECAQVVTLGRAAELSTGAITANADTQEDTRRSQITWLERNGESEWIFERLEHAIREANSAYGFDLSPNIEIQIAHYGIGDHYTWHMDIGRGELSTRKLSVTLQLSDPANYDGGELELFCFSEQSPTRGQGALVVFPSFLVHRVAPITRGTRWSLVAWVHGTSFR